MLSNNLLKGQWVQVQEEETRVIDNNVLLERRLRQGELQPLSFSDEQTEEAFASEGFQSGLNAEELEGLLTDPDELGTVIKAEPAPPPMPVYDGPSPEELIAQAQQEIAQMQMAAQAEIEAARKNAIASGKEEGFQQGYREGTAKANAEIAQTKKQLEAAYEQKVHELEPEFVKQLSGIYEHVFHVKLGESYELIMGLLERCMQNIENSSSYIVHVSKEDYPFVSMQKKTLAEAMVNKNAALDIVEDAALKKNECMIDADGGIYDCSLDIQLEALQKELKLLSYEGVN